MNIFDEIQNRWHRVFEQPTDEGKTSQVQRIEPLQIAKDIQTLQDRLKRLEREVSELQNGGFSSSVGPLLDIKNGEIYYRLRGLFIRSSSIATALNYIVQLLSTDSSFAKKFRSQFGETVEKEVKEVFNDPL